MTRKKLLVTPAKAMTRKKLLVTPAKAGAQKVIVMPDLIRHPVPSFWTPAYAGATSSVPRPTIHEQRTTINGRIHIPTAR